MVCPACCREARLAVACMTPLPTQSWHAGQLQPAACQLQPSSCLFKLSPMLHTGCSDNFFVIDLNENGTSWEFIDWPRKNKVVGARCSLPVDYR